MGIINREKSLVPKNSKAFVKKGDGELLNSKKESELLSGFVDKLLVRSGKLEEIERKIRVSLQSAEKAERSAENAGNKPVGFWNFKKPALEALQAAGIDLAKATTINSETNNLILEFLSEQAEFDKFILTIGIFNKLQQQDIFNKLQSIFEGGSKDGLTESMKIKVKSIIQNIKEQDDIKERQKKLGENVKTLHSEHKTQATIVEEHNKLIKNNKKRISENAKIVKDNSEMIQSMNEQLNEIKRSIKKTDKEVNDIKDLKGYIIKKYPKIKLWFFLLLGIVGITLV